MDIGTVGLWTPVFRIAASEAVRDAIKEVEALGYGTAWFPGGAPDTAFARARELIEATDRIVVATGIVSAWSAGPDVVAARNQELNQDHPGRFLLGLGISHPEAVNRQTPGTYRRPLAVMAEYLDELDRLDPEAKPEQRILAALGPKMLALAAARTAGAHPYFVPVEHTTSAREVLGPSAVLAPEQKVLLETDPERARAIARQHMAVYLGLVNYTNNLRHFGFGDADFADGGSDRLVDAIVAWGDTDAIVERVRAHHTAGADHVCLQVLTEDRQEVPLAQWRTLARGFELS